MLAMLDTILATEFVLHQLSTAHQVNSDIMEYAMHHAQLELALKETIVKEPALPVLGHITMDATELAQLNSPLMMLVLNHAQLELLFKMEFAKFHPKVAPTVNSLILPHHHADFARAHALNALLLLHIVPLAHQASL